MKNLDKNLYIAGQILADDIQKAADEGISLIINNRPDNEEPGQLSHTEAEKISQQLGIEYIYLPMANGTPMPEGLVDEFKTLVEQDPNKKVLAHCRSGTRCAIIWSIGQVQSGKTTPDQALQAAAGAGVNISMVKPLLDSISPNS